MDSLTAERCWACGFCDSKMAMYQFGMFAALLGAALFLALVTFAAMPVSTTHAIVGGVVGMTVTATSWGCLNWSLEGGLLGIVISWVASPLLAGLIGCSMYLATYHLVMRRADPVQAALRAVPLLYGLTSAFMLFLILMKSPLTAHAVPAEWRWISAGLAFVLVPITVTIFVMPEVRSDLLAKECAAVDGGLDDEVSSNADADAPSDSTRAPSAADAAAAVNSAPPLRRAQGGEGYSDDGTYSDDDSTSSASESSKDEDLGKGLSLFGQGAMTRRQQLATLAFKNLLVFNAFVESFAHGANDTANATGPYGALVATYREGIYACEGSATPTWIMAVAGLCVALGVNLSGWRVIQTVGKELIAVDFHRGYCVEFASGASVVIASFLEMPISTTHCQVGAVVFVGALAGGWSSVSWGMFGRIAVTWVCTLPFAGGLATGLMWFRFLS